MAITETDRKLPYGVADITEGDCALKSDIEAKVSAAFDSFGYNEIQTPTFEYLGVFDDDPSGGGDAIKFVDRSGRIIALRPDYTPAISRFTASHKSEADFPLRLRYSGSIFRGGESFGARQKEFTQAGAELLGDPSPEADAEIICATIEALRGAGLEDFQLELGHAGLLKGLVGGRLGEEAFRELTELLDKKSVPEIDEFCRRAVADDETAALLRELPLLYGGTEIAEKMLTRRPGAESEAALENLLEVCYAVKDYGLERFIGVDLGLVRSFGYYTGVMFKGLTHSMAFPICGGGRYDNFSRRFGPAFPATGTAVWTDRVMAAVARSKKTLSAPAADVLVWYESDADRPAAYAAARAEREKGRRAICERHGFASDEEESGYLSKRRILSAFKAGKEGPR